MSGSAAEAVLKRLRAEADPQVRREMGERYGIRTERAFGVPMRLMKSIAEPLAPDHLLADRLWTSGWYEARTIAVLIDDPDQVTVAQMRRWCDDFDNWAIVDSACFNLFDRTPDAWAMVPEWAADDREFVRRAGFAQLWALALHDRDAPDEAFGVGLRLIELHAADTRRLVTKSMTMALRAIGQKRPNVRPDVVRLAERLAASSDAASRRVGRPIVAAFSAGQRA